MMIAGSVALSQEVLEVLLNNDPIVLKYRALFALLDWSQIEERDERRPWPGRRPHPASAYIKTLLVKVCEQKVHVTEVRRFLVEHPLLVWELGFRPVVDARHIYGFDVSRTLPCERHLRHKLQTIAPEQLQQLLTGTVRALQAEIPGLGVTVSVDVKHLYAWVRENNLKEQLPNRHDPARQPVGDPDCRLGVKRGSNQDETRPKETLWGYGSGVLAATDPRYGDVVLAELTQPFNQHDSSYFAPLHQRGIAALGFHPTNLAADAAFDAWYVYEPFAQRGGIAAIPLNTRGHEPLCLLPDGRPLCPIGLAMVPSYRYTFEGVHFQLFCCPLLRPQPTGESCDHVQFLKGPGCVKRLNAEAGGQQRLQLDRESPAFKLIYNQRTAAERINSQATDLGIERPKLRNHRSIANRNTLIYIVINLRALQRVRATKTAQAAHAPQPTTPLPLAA